MYFASENPLTVVIIIGVIVGLVEFAKKLGVNGNWSIVLSMVIGLVLGLAWELQNLYPQISPWLNVIIGGLTTALSASGLYDLSKRFARLE